MNILLIEDDEEKSRKIEEFLAQEFPSPKVTVAKSFSSGLRALIAGSSTLDFVLLDMSMPSYDVSHQEPGGGTPESFAGRELLAQMRLRSINVPTIVVTQFDSFGETSKRVSLEQLDEELSTRYAPPFRGLVYYNSTQEGWRGALKRLIDKNSTLG